MKKEEENKGVGWGITALILGILSFLVALIPFLGLTLSIIAIPISIVAIKKNNGKGMAIAGLVFAIVALVVGLAASIISVGVIYFISSINFNSTTNKTIPEYKIGETFNISNTAFTVTGIESRYNFGQAGTQDAITTQGIFYIIELKVENKGKQTNSNFWQSFQLVDNQGRKFSSTSSADQALASEGINSFSDTGSQLQPGLPVTGAKVFELPKDARGLKLEIDCCGFFDKSTALVNLGK